MPGNSPTVTITKRPQVNQTTGDTASFLVIMDCAKLANMNIIEIECRVVITDPF